MTRSYQAYVPDAAKDSYILSDPVPPKNASLPDAAVQEDGRLSFRISPNLRKNIDSGSGFWGGFGGRDVSRQYARLPEEYAVFSKINENCFHLTDTEQHQLLSACLRHMRSCLLDLYTQVGVVRVLPKLSITMDDDEAIILNWAYTGFRIYFNFERAVEHSFFGIVVQHEDGVATNTGKLNSENCASVVESVLLYVINHS